MKITSKIINTTGSLYDLTICVCSLSNYFFVYLNRSHTGFYYFFGPLGLMFALSFLEHIKRPCFVVRTMTVKSRNANKAIVYFPLLKLHLNKSIG